MKILVTGGCGFIGYNLIKELSQKENEIYSLDNNFTGNKKIQKENVHYINGSTNDIEKLVNIKPDIVYHLGEYSRISTSFEDIEKVWEYNANGTFQVLQFCVKNKCKLVYAGSSSKFGNNGRDKNLSPYAWTKAKNIELIKNYGEWYGLEYAIAYFYNVYGEEQISKGRYATVLGIFQEQYRNSKPMTVVEPGTQKRFFTHVSDTIRGLILVGETANGDHYHLCAHQNLFSIDELARLFSDNVEYIPSRPGNRQNPNHVNYRYMQGVSWGAEHNLIDYIEKFKKGVNL